MLDGVMLLWFVLAAAALLFVAVDIRTTPESAVLKWGFVLLTAYTGVVGAFLYVLGCREPLPGLHERYVATRWRQTLGSTMHCVAGDGVGILAGAVLSSVFGLAGLVEVVLEYILGFAFGWTIFQALFMRDMAGGSYLRALRETFISELLSMNLLMAGMVPTVMALKSRIPSAADPTSPRFWFVMSMGLLVGFIFAYPMNWWLVAYQARNDDGAAGGCRCRRACRHGRHGCGAARHDVHGERRTAVAADPSDDAVVVPRIGGGRGDRFPVAGDVSRKPTSRRRVQVVSFRQMRRCAKGPDPCFHAERSCSPPLRLRRPARLRARRPRPRRARARAARSQRCCGSSAAASR
jgi:hypothetical protein